MAEKQESAVEWMARHLRAQNSPYTKEQIIEIASEMEKEQKGYSEEQVREMLFMALNEPQEECCTTHTKDSIVRKVLKTFKSE